MPEQSGPVEYKLDWDKLSENFKADPSVNDTFVKDVYVALGNNGYVQMPAALADATDPEVALDYADTFLRRLNGVALLSKTSDSDEWFVFDAIAPGVQCRHTIELQKVYR